MGDDESDSEEYSREERDADEAERRKREVSRISKVQNFGRATKRYYFKL